MHGIAGCRSFTKKSGSGENSILCYLVRHKQDKSVLFVVDPYFYQFAECQCRTGVTPIYTVVNGRTVDMICPPTQVG